MPGTLSALCSAQLAIFDTKTALLCADNMNMTNGKGRCEYPEALKLQPLTQRLASLGSCCRDWSILGSQATINYKFA